MSGPAKRLFWPPTFVQAIVDACHAGGGTAPFVPDDVPPCAEEPQNQFDADQALLKREGATIAWIETPAGREGGAP